MSKGIRLITCILFAYSIQLAVGRFQVGDPSVGVYWLLVAMLHIGNYVKGMRERYESRS